VAKSKLQKPRQVKVRTALCCTALDATEARRQYASTTGCSPSSCTARSNSGRPCASSASFSLRARHTFS